MTYNYEHGDKEQVILNQCAQTKRPLPDFIANAPEIEEGNELYFKAFNHLCTTRQVGMAIAPISVLHIIEYCGYLKLNEVETEDFIYVIMRVDAEYLTLVNAKNK